MTNPSGGESSKGFRVTEYLAPLVLAVLVALGFWWYVAQIRARAEKQPAPPPHDLRQSLPPLPGTSAR